MRPKHEPWIWLRHAAVAVLYFAGYTALRHVSFSYWFLPAGFRLLCLMFVPTRYWPALLAGEVLSLGKISYECYETLGLGFALLKLFPPIALAMPIVQACRTRLGLFGPKQSVRINTLILCTLLLSLVTAARDFLFLWITPVPPGEEPVTLAWAQGYFLGNYLGILTVVPLVLMLWESIRGTSRQGLWARLFSSRLAMDSVALLIPALLLLLWIAMTHVKDDAGHAARIAMFLPVAALAMRHGWRGAALGGSAASIAIAVAMPALYDPATMQAEVFMSFAITTLLMLGSRIAVLHAREEKERIEGRLALQAAQQEFYLSELRMQHAANTIAQIGESLSNTHERLMGQMRVFMPAAQERSFTKQGIAAQQEIFRLADGISPRALSHNGLSHVLRQGSIAHAFESADVNYACDLAGLDPADLAPATQLAVYRMACEGAVYLYEQATLSTVRMNVRSGVAKGRRWIVMRMDGVHATGALDLMPSRMACEQFANRLGASRRGIGALHDLARVHHGMVHVRSTAQGTRLALLLHDAAGAPGRVN
jgi:two-component system, NarL family, sensor histidine kinase FusK